MDAREVIARAIAVRSYVERGYVSEQEAPDAIVTAEGLSDNEDTMAWAGSLADAALSAFLAHLEASGRAIVPVEAVITVSSTPEMADKIADVLRKINATTAPLALLAAAKDQTDG